MTESEKALQDIKDEILLLEGDLELVEGYLNSQQMTAFYLDRLRWKISIQERIDVLRESLK